MAIGEDLEVAVLQFPEVAYSITSGGVTVAEVVTGGRNLITLTVANTGSTNALTSCIIYTKASSDDDYQAYFGGTDFASTTNANIEFVSSNTPHDLAAGSTSRFGIYISGAYAVKVVLASTSGTTVTVTGNLKRE